MLLYIKSLKPVSEHDLYILHENVVTTNQSVTMRNLRNKRHFKLSFDGLPSNFSAGAWDASDDSLVLAFGPSERDPAISLKRIPRDIYAETQATQDVTAVASWDAPSSNPDLTVDRILDLHCFPDSKIVTLVLVGGDIVVVREEPQAGADAIEIVGSVDAGINAAAWSPDEELLAVSTGANTLLFMTRDFESVSNIVLSPKDVKVSSHVSVGWGKKETQFKGRGVAKTLRDPTMPEYVDEGTLSPADDGKTTISWRGDGQYVAVNGVLDVEPKRRIIRFYSRDGTLESVSEPVNGLEGALSWKPSGQTLAGIQRRDDGIDVVFFERNGLRHGDFSLRLDKDELPTVGSSIDLKWNADSTVLGVSMRDRVQLWTMSNYHYYLKQEIRYEEAYEGSTRTIWHPEKALQLCCSCQVDLRVLSYKFEVCRGSVIPPYDMGFVAVIDGKRLKVTPLRTANIPPPMAFEEIELPDSAIDVAVSRTGTEIAVLHYSSVSLWTCDYSSKPVVRAVIKESFGLPVERTGASSNRLIAKLEAEWLFSHQDPDRILYDLSRSHALEGSIDSKLAWVNTSDHEEVIWYSGFGVKIQFFLDELGFLIAQSTDYKLRIAGCTSYVITSSHLIYTTGQHLLKLVHLHKGELEVPPDEPEKDERCRSIERGAKIVTVMPSAYSLVLQMPRGNLETIYPRALVLAGIRKSITARDYKKAFLACRTHRVDMNILHDYAPEQFMGDIELFLKQVKKAEYVDLFLSSLSEENVSETMYRETVAPTEKPVMNGVVDDEPLASMLGDNSKANKICDAFLQVLGKQSSTRLQNIVTAHVCRNPPDLEAGLQLVSELRKQGDDERLEQAVEHISFLADVNQLYETALSLYDLDVALLVAQQSQKDPREYLPYLQRLHEMPPLRRQFHIDDDLRRNRKALGHLHALGAFDELKSYIKKHELYSAAVDLYRYDNPRLIELMRLFADYLSSRNRFKEAGIAYEYLADYSLAYEAFRAVSMWRECLANAALVPLAPIEMSTLAQDLASSLEESKDYRASATIHLDYLNDPKGATRLLCKGSHFAEAIRQVAMRQRPEILKSVIDPGLIEASATMTELFAEMKSQLAAQVPRLRDLRQKKVDDPMAFIDGADGSEGDVPDNISLAPTDASTSGGTFMTRYTNRSMGTLATNATRKTSKNKRREERKRARGKKGTVYEEEYLVNSVARLIERLNAVGEDCGQLIEGLMRRSMRERAVAVQSLMDDLVEDCKGCMQEVFVASENTSDQPQVSANEGDPPRPWGGQGVLWDALTSPKLETPVLKSFERLALLDRMD